MGGWQWWQRAVVWLLASAAWPRPVLGQRRLVYDRERLVASARLYGNIDAYAYYFLDVLVGYPNLQRVSVILDTGSAICAFPCKNCDHCGPHLDPSFDYAGSQTASWLSCGEDCGTCSNGRCSYSQKYIEGSGISGSFFRDYVQLGDEFQHNPPVRAVVGCHNRETKQFYTQRVNGIFGIGPSRPGRPPTILSELFKDQQHINTRVFAVCLSGNGGKLTVGGFNASLHTKVFPASPGVKVGGYAGPRRLSSNIVWTDLWVQRHYRVELHEVAIGVNSLYADAGSMGGKVVASGYFGEAILDSGTTWSYFPTPVFTALRDSIADHCKKTDQCGAELTGSMCWTVPDSDAGLARFPSLRFRFGDGQAFFWRPRAYLYRRGAEDPPLFCYGFADNGAEQHTVLGATWMLHTEVIFDLEQSKLGLAEAACPEFTDRPGPPTGHSVATPEHLERKPLKKESGLLGRVMQTVRGWQLGRKWDHMMQTVRGWKIGDKLGHVMETFRGWKSRLVGQSLDTVTVIAITALAFMGILCGMGLAVCHTGRSSSYKKLRAKRAQTLRMLPAEEDEVSSPQGRTHPIPIEQEQKPQVGHNNDPDASWFACQAESEESDEERGPRDIDNGVQLETVPIAMTESLDQSKSKLNGAINARMVN